MRTQKEKEESVLKLLDRIKKTQDGKELIEYLNELSAMNYRVFKKSSPDTDEFCKGYAVCVDSIIESFENCSLKLIALESAKAAASPLDPDGEITTNPID